MKNLLAQQTKPPNLHGDCQFKSLEMVLKLSLETMYAPWRSRVPEKLISSINEFGHAAPW
jgi:hypothetical protein